MKQNSVWRIKTAFSELEKIKAVPTSDVYQKEVLASFLEAVMPGFDIHIPKNLFLILCWQLLYLCRFYVAQIYSVVYVPNALA
jgi:hypothetical protein